MLGWPKLLLLPLLPLLLAAEDDELAVGRRIYRDGLGRDAISARQRQFAADLDARDYMCARCHGADGRGAREGGVTAPSLTTAQAKTVEEAAAWLAAAFSGISGTDGHPLKPVMPSYSLSVRDQQALAAYIRTLPYPVEPGVTAQWLYVGINLTGVGLDADGVASVLALMRQHIDAINRQGGVFGRRIALMESDSQEVVLTLTWAFDSANLSWQFGVRPPGLKDLSPNCGMLHPPVSEQMAWLTRKLTGEGWSVHIVDPATPDSAPVHAAGGEEAVIYAGGGAELAAVVARYPANPLYAFNDLLTKPALTEFGSRFTLVMPFDLQAQINHVEQLQQMQPAFSPRTASIGLEMARALDITLKALEQQGRRVTAPELCQRVNKLARQSWRFTLLPAGRSVPPR